MEAYAKRLRAKRRFKMAGKLVILNKFWMTKLDDEDIDLGENVARNVLLLKHRKKGYKTLLTQDDKGLLCKNAEERTEEELQVVRKKLRQLNCFKRYPLHVQDRMCEVCYYCYYGPGRVIVRQNHPSQCLYFILTGSAGVYKKTYDVVSDSYIDQQALILTEGSQFGEIALLHNIPRQATIITLEECELLKMWKEDFNSILKSTIQATWDHIQAGLRSFEYFDMWTPMEIRECCVISKIREFKPGSLVLSKSSGAGSYVYFVLSGQVQIIEQMEMTVRKDVKGHTVYKLIRRPEPTDDTSTSHEDVNESAAVLIRRPNEEKKERNKNMYKAYRISVKNLSRGSNLDARIVRKFVQVCLLNERACFGFGELTANRFIVAKLHTECLLIPRYFLLQHNTTNEWTKVKNFCLKNIPSTDVIFQHFLFEQKWRKYRKELVESITNKPPVNSIHNIPYSIRLDEVYKG